MTDKTDRKVPSFQDFYPQASYPFEDRLDKGVRKPRKGIFTYLQPRYWICRFGKKK